MFVCRGYVCTPLHVHVHSVCTYILQGMHFLMCPFCIQLLLPIATPPLRSIYPILPVGNNNMAVKS